MIDIFALVRSQKDLDELEELKDKIRNMTPDNLDCESVLDLLNPIIRKKEDQLVNMKKLYKELS